MHFEELLKRIANVLQASSIPYMIIGGQAVLVHGEPRLTKDIDVTLGIPPFDPAPVLQVVEKLSLEILVADPEEFLTKTFVLPALDKPSGIRVDLICSLSEYEKQAIDRAINVYFGETPVRFIGLEDLIIHKAIAGRPRDLEDARLIILKHSTINIDFIRTHLQSHDTELATDFERRLNNILDDIKRSSGK